MSESKHEQIAAALEARLRTIQSDGGTTYWYTPDVLRCLEPTSAFLDPSRPVVLFLSPGSEDHREGESSSMMASEAEFYITACAEWAPGTSSPWDDAASGTSRWLVANRLTQDVLRALLATVTLGGLADNIIRDSLIVDRARWIERWVVVELRFTVAYSYPAGTP